MARVSSRAMASPRPVPPASGAAETNGSNNLSRNSSRTPGPWSMTSISQRAVEACGADDDRLVAARMILHRLRGVAHQVHQDAVEMLGIGDAGEPLLRCRRDTRCLRSRAARPPRRPRRRRRRRPRFNSGGFFVGAAVFQRLRPQGRRRGRWCVRAAARSGARRDPPISPGGPPPLRGREHVAQVVADARDRGAERGEAFLLPQSIAHLLGHVGGGALGAADLVGACAARKRDRHILRPVAEAFDRAVSSCIGRTKANAARCKRARPPPSGSASTVG